MSWDPMNPPRVAVFGGGVAGLTTAHELIERGFAVWLFEAGAAVGGKAASAYGPYQTLSGPFPSEHGFRLFPSFYQHVVDTMQRIPSGAGNVADHLHATVEAGVARNGKPLVTIPRAGATSLSGFLDLVKGTFGLFGPGAPAEDLVRFQVRMLQFLTSSDDRRASEYEHTSWWSFVEGDRFRSADFQRQIQAFIKTMVAMDALQGNADTVGKAAMQLLLDTTGDGSRTDRVLDGPTSDVWLEPWRTYLDAQPRFHRPANATLTTIHVDAAGTAITGVDVSGYGANASFDYYVFALPLYDLRDIPQSPGAPRLAFMHQLDGLDLDRNLDWCTGIQFLLTNDAPLVRGHMYYPECVWGLSTISQAQFWGPDFLNKYGQGLARGLLSVDVSNWEAGLGALSGNIDQQHVADAIWAQLSAALFDGTTKLLPDPYLDYHFDPNVTFMMQPHSRQLQGYPVWNRTPHFIHPPGSYEERPEIDTGLGNVFLASDYVRTTTDLACMEGANEAGRRAANFIITRAGCPAAPAKLWSLVEPSWLDTYKQLDARLFALGDPHVFDIIGLDTVAGALTAAEDLAKLFMP